MEAITREEKIMSGENLTPITRKEMFLAKAAGMDVEPPDPITREEFFLSKIGGTGGGGGGSAVEDKGYVNFYDYDGTLLHSYSKDEVDALTELPPLPEHEGLICQGWNYDLDVIKSHNRAVNVGATYITDDGKTRLYISIVAEGRMDVDVAFTQTVSKGVTIDWGDGSETDTINGTSGVHIPHTYQSIGEYVISLDVADGCEVGLGDNSSTWCVMGYTDTGHKAHCNMLQRVEIGNRVTSINSYAFQYCYSLTSVVIPNGVTTINFRTFTNCYSLMSIVVPTGVTKIGQYTFSACYSLTSVVIPNGVAHIDSYAFDNCVSLPSIVLPNGIGIIGNGVFNQCRALKSIVIPGGVTSLGTGIFSSNLNLKSIVVLDGVQVINSNTFSSCTSVASVVLPDGLQGIGSYAFQSCTLLTSVLIPESVTTLADGVFSGCIAVKFYDFTKHTTIPKLVGSSVFYGMASDCEIRVPTALYDEWIAATNWSTLASKIVAA